MTDRMVNQSTLQHLAQRMTDESIGLAATWVERLHERRLNTLDVFPSHQLLGHFPLLIVAIAAHLEGSAPPIDSNAEVLARAAELGELRHVQQASVDQLLREYRVLAELLENFIDGEVVRMEDAEPRDVVFAMRRVGTAVRVLQQHTVDTFVARYTQMIERQTTQLRKFSRLVSHEIRQPLAVLQVIARALPVPDGDAESARMMDIFDRSVVRLADVTGKLERLARISPATDLSMSERAVALTDVARDAAARLKEAAEARGVSLQVDPHLPVVRLDPTHAELIFWNLIANAIAYADPEKSARFVEIYRGSGEAPSVIVRDNGVGMAAPRLQTIFREFVRAHAQRDDDARPLGLGLGLSIVRECMDQSNGTVRVDSIEGRGTTFKLTWPLTAAR